MYCIKTYVQLRFTSSPLVCIIKFFSSHSDFNYLHLLQTARKSCLVDLKLNFQVDIIKVTGFNVWITTHRNSKVNKFHGIKGTKETTKLSQPPFACEGSGQIADTQKLWHLRELTWNLRPTVMAIAQTHIPPSPVRVRVRLPALSTSITCHHTEHCLLAASLCVQSISPMSWFYVHVCACHSQTPE